MPGISLTTLGTAYVQDFDALSNVAGSTTNVLTIPGWALTEGGGGGRDNEQYAVDTGGSNTGDIYSYGAAGSTDRALGALRSGTLVPTTGAFFDNNTGSTITSLDIAYAGEQWRLGTAGRADRIDFQYSLNATGLVSGTWIDVDALDFTTPDTVTTGAKNGNDAVHRVSLAATLSGLSIAPGSSFAIRWADLDATGADDGLAVDDFSLTANGGGFSPTVSISDASIVEGNSGTTVLNFTVTRTDTSTAFTVDFATGDGTATVANNDYAAASGTLDFVAGGAASQQVSVTINGDATAEPTETFSVTLANLASTTGATIIGDGAATGSIINDDVSLTPVYTIQGSGSSSPFTGQSVITRGIVTGVASNGFYLQDATGDGNAATSDGIFVFTSSAPPAAAAIGNLVDVVGTVLEFIPSGAVTGTLSLTEIGGGPIVTLLTSGNALPSAVVIGSGGLTPPNSDFVAGATFFEALEGMRVTVLSPQATSPTNQFREIFTVASNGADATGVNSRGAILISGGATSFGNTDTVGGDFNPERIQIDDGLGFATPDVNVGARLNDVTGIVSYSFGNYEVLATAPVTVATPSPLVKTGTTLVGTADHILVGSYNAENLDPGDGAARFATVAGEIVNKLNAPDILALQEIQDNNGPSSSSVTSANVTLQQIVAAVSAAGGPQYAFIDNTFIGNNTNGGEPGGNIRTTFLYRTDRVSLVEGSVRTVGAAGNAVTAGPELAQQTDPNHPFFGSRPPLAADFVFNGEVITIVNNHFTSKGGSGILMGSVQPPFDAGEVQRAAQAQAVNNFVDNLLASDPDARVVVTGDLNDFAFEQPLSIIAGTASITNYSANGSDPFNATATYTVGGTAILSDLQDLLPADQRFDYIFDGNAQTLDHMLVTSSLAVGAQFEPVHINAEFFDQTSDHDPLVGLFDMSVNQVPVLTSPTAFIVAEPGTAVGGITATDADLPAQTLAYSLVLPSGDNGAGEDGALFQIDANTGALSFITAPDFETPADVDLDNLYAVTVRVADSEGGVATQTVTVEVTNVNETPSITSDGGGATANVLATENSVVVTTVTAIDPDAGAALVFTIAGGTDEAKFTLDAGTGVLAFIAAPDYEAATDFNGDNVYEVNVQVSDGLGGIDTQALSVTVGNVTGSTIIGTNLADVVNLGTTVPGQPFPTGEEDTILGNDGADLLDGAGGADSLSGGAGNDTFVVDTLGDVVTEGLNAGTDTVQTALGVYTLLAANVENLTYTGAGSFTGTGNTLGNTIRGGAGADRLDGAAGVDTMFGATGNDTYLVDNVADVVWEVNAAGVDTVLSTAGSFTLWANVENLTYVGAASFTGIGNAQANAIIGGAGNDSLNGAGGNDSLTGGGGNDTYVVDAVGDAVVEMAGGGTDTVQTTLAIYALAAGGNVENLAYVGAGTFTGTGNELDNAIIGGNGNDTLNGGNGNDTLTGGAGSDSLTGGSGNDVYAVDATTDIVVEAGNGGTDTVQTALAVYTVLAGNVENLTYTGAGSFTGTGNTLGNTIRGGAGADSLDGGAGVDTLFGGGGNDTYRMDSSADVAWEVAGGGVDTVQSLATSHTLWANVENLSFIGVGNFTGTGNAQANVIVGGTGNDTLTGAGGNDTLTGGLGNDSFVFRPGFGNDVVSDFQIGNAIDHDVLDLRGLGFASIADVLANTDAGINAVIHAGLDSITLIGVTQADLAANTYDLMI